MTSHISDHDVNTAIQASNQFPSPPEMDTCLLFIKKILILVNIIIREIYLFKFLILINSKTEVLLQLFHALSGCS